MKVPKMAGRRGGQGKAFAFASGRKAQISAQRGQELKEKRLRAPLHAAIKPSILINNNAGSLAPPPMVVAMFGAKGCGKTTLIRSLIKKWTKRAVPHCAGTLPGPITCQAGSKRRITLIECPGDDLLTALDVVKVADVAVMVMDGRHSKGGMQMETFELLNLLQVHGMPRILGVLTHLDGMAPERAKSVKKNVKKRFWTETFDGAKLFAFSGKLEGSARYLLGETQNLARLILVMKPKPMTWKSSHSFLISDHIEELFTQKTVPNPTKQEGHDQENDELEYGESRMALYGWLRGGSTLRTGQQVHIPGLGDFPVAAIEPIPDPMAIPNTPSSASSSAPLANDSITGSVGGKKKGCKLFAPSVALHHPSPSDIKNGPIQTSGRQQKDGMDGLEFDTEASDAESQDEAVLDGLRNLTVKKTAAKEGVFSLFKDYALQESSGDDNDDEQDEKDSGDESDFSDGMGDVSSDSDQEANGSDGFDRNKENEDAELDLNDEATLTRLRARFENNFEENGEMSAEEDAANDGFEDLEGEESKIMEVEGEDGEEQARLAKKAALKASFLTEHDQQVDKKKMGKKHRLKERLQEENDEDAVDPGLEAQRALQTELLAGKTQEEVARLVGCLPGTYVRIVLTKVPMEFLQTPNPLAKSDDSGRALPCFAYRFVVLGSLDVGAGETSIGHVQAKIRQHRWHVRPLKSHDPAIISVGWRRYQTCPVFFSLDPERPRFLKYTPGHVHCGAEWWGGGVPPGTPFLAFRSVAEGQRGWRIAASGTVTSCGPSTPIVKKLKLIGYPLKVHHCTAFIKEMFSSALEVANFVGAKLKTPSGIRGILKKAVKAPPGAFRATFEDKLLLSDVVFLRTWVRVKPSALYLPLLNHIQPSPENNSDASASSNNNSMLLMKLGVELRQEKHLPTPFARDSLYRRDGEDDPQDRLAQRKFNPLHIPRSLEERLPYATKPKLTKARNPKKLTYRQQRSLNLIMLEGEEKEKVKMLQALGTVKNERDAKRKAAKAKTKAAYHTKLAKEQVKREEQLSRAKQESIKRKQQRHNRH